MKPESAEKSYCQFYTISIVSRGHATLHLAVSVGRSVGPSFRHIFEFRAVFALLLLPNGGQLDCRVVRDWIAVYPALFYIRAQSS